jgi:hypothetical protein
MLEMCMYIFFKRKYSHICTHVGLYKDIPIQLNSNYPNRLYTKFVQNCLFVSINHNRRDLHFFRIATAPSHTTIRGCTFFLSTLPPRCSGDSRRPNPNDRAVVPTWAHGPTTRAHGTSAHAAHERWAAELKINAVWNVVFTYIQNLKSVSWSSSE